MASIAAENSGLKNSSRADHIGIWASILCAIHCALTPALLILLPAFGKAWAHPATHWGMALIVIPIAVFMVRKDYRKHARKWIVATGSVGITLIVIGAILPYVENKPSRQAPPSSVFAETNQNAPESKSVNCEQSASSG